MGEKEPPETAQSPKRVAQASGLSVTSERTPADAVLELQATAGNLAVTSLLKAQVPPPGAARIQRQPQPDTVATQAERRARRRFARARSLHEQRRYAPALRLFEAIARTPDALPEVGGMARVAWNIALCKAHLGDFENAMTYAADYAQLTRGPGDPDPQELVARINRIRSGEPEQPPTRQPEPPSEEDQLRERIAAEDRAAGRIPAVDMTEDRARQIFAEAQGQMDSDPRASLRMFEDVFRAPHLGPRIRSRMLWNMATAHERLGQPDEAIRNLMMFVLYEGVSEGLRRQAETRIRQLRETGRSDFTTLPPESE